ncbi:MAG: TOBE domain-containing protein [Propionibacteriaceae bacterium]|nr:TOBE domain-containing protein [Propionibacteriaceae bacterium]
MTHLRINDAAGLLGVSDDTLRRWIDQGRLGSTTDDAGRLVVAGAQLAQLAQDIAADHPMDQFDAGVGARSSRNHLTGLVTRVISDAVMSQVELQCGRYRIVSLISTEAVEELGLTVGSVATAVIKATNVSIEGHRS